MTMYELMTIWMEDCGKQERIKFEPSKLEGHEIMTDTEPCTVGTGKEIIAWLLKYEVDLSDYKLVKRTRKGKTSGLKR